MRDNRPVIHLWSVDTSRVGGVQRYARNLMAILPKCELQPTVRVISIRGKGRRARFCFAIRTIFWSMIDKPDVTWTVHLHLARLFAIFPIYHSKLWVSLHGIECWELPKSIDRLSLTKADRLLPVGTYTAWRVQQVLPDTARKTFILNNYLSSIPAPLPNRESARQKWSLPSDALVITTVARLAQSEAYKGHREIIDVLPRLKKTTPNITYLVVGDGDDRRHLEQYALDKGVGSCVCFTGGVSDADLELAFSATDLFVLAGTGEGFGIVLLEAMARGIAVVGSELDGCVDALDGGRLGILTNPRDPERLYADLHRALSACAANSGPAAKLKLRAEVLQRFGPDAMALRLNQLMTEAF